MDANHCWDAGQCCCFASESSHCSALPAFCGMACSTSTLLHIWSSSGFLFYEYLFKFESLLEA